MGIPIELHEAWKIEIERRWLIKYNQRLEKLKRWPPE